MLITQEPKYAALNGRIVNRASGLAIPDDEPVIIFRARDVHARRVLHFYAALLPLGTHRDAVMQRIEHFDAFALAYPERMKEPDTEKGFSPKYGFHIDRIQSLSTGQAIPDDEPVFIFRGRDLQALLALQSYVGLLPASEHRNAVELRISDFVAFAHAHPERMKQPDTAPPPNPTTD